MITTEKNKIKKLLPSILLFLGASVLTIGCEKDNNPLPEQGAKPTIDNIELGLGNAGLAMIGEDFHFNSDIVAAERLDKVEIRISQKKGETYSKPWEHAIVWAQYRDLKNTTVHKHFTIPKDAVEGRYDFLITVYDQSGSRLEVRRDFAIYKKETMPVTPIITQHNLSKNWEPVYDSHGMTDNPKEKFFKGDTLRSQVSISFVKGDGIVYMLLIKKSANHNPKTIEEIDFSKSIVYDMYEHRSKPSIYTFGNAEFDLTTSPFTVIKDLPELKIGAANDFKSPVANKIDGSKAWESGEYNLVVIYKNTTENKTVSKSIPFSIDFR
ncbi:DUF4625 domain-containing protein [Pedobacter namyangjuensis]|uniref:DUF4625 domain-containing protein n=1 Tax=Pedobacter namyangjuensis TaxID=600626 RepID=UPI000DE4DC4C|nr:DUF4625 domain-containing protein [Pedobacter namyangjuensis]